MTSSISRVLMLALFLGLNGFGVLLTVEAPTLPYGRLAPWFLAGSLALAVGMGSRWLQAHLVARALLTGAILRLSPSAIPRRRDHTFLGFAFLWQRDHAERLYYCVARGIEPPEEQQARFGGNTLLHGLGMTSEKPLFISDQRRTHHTLVLGSPGEGKTRFLELAIRQLIGKGDVVVIVDPKGDKRLINTVKQVCEESGRGDAFRLVALPWPMASCAYNPLSNFSVPSEITDRIMGIFPPATGEAESFRGYQWGATNAVVQVLYMCGIPITIHRVLRYLRKPGQLFMEAMERRVPELGRLDLQAAVNRYRSMVQSGALPKSKEFDDLLHYITEYKPDHYHKMVASLLPQLERLAAGVKEDLLSPEPESTRRLLTWEAIDRQQLVVYFYLGSLHGEESANAVGKMLLLDFEAYVACRYSYDPDGRNRRISLFVDEAHHLVSRTFLHILAEARGADVAVTLSTQTTAQFEQVFGSRAAVDEIVTQHFLAVQFQSRNPRECKDFADLAGQREMRVIGESHRYEPAFFSSGFRNVEDFRAQFTQNITYREAALVPPWAIAQLPTFHYFARLGGRIYKARIPLLDEPTCTYAADLQRGAA
ncbi:MAG: type IV secretion system DNA-binding domain-containing protein [Planctomycetes bacterium]|nr:type IV secretion system DNA-binding domain-containing protein [Planctomycetota bacterium]